MPGVQVNIRVDQSIKLQAEAAFALAGYEPGKAMRAFWAFAAHCLGNPDRLADVLAAFQADKPDDSNLQTIADRIESLPRSLDSMCAQAGIVLAPPMQHPTILDDNDLLEEALCERMLERGLL